MDGPLTLDHDLALKARHWIEEIDFALLRSLGLLGQAPGASQQRRSPQQLTLLQAQGTATDPDSEAK